MRKDRITIDGYKLFMRSWTGKTGPNLVLVHGVGASSRYWLPLIRRLKLTYNIYAPDFPGYGRSEKPHDALPLAALADQLHELTGHLEAKDLILVGNSYGCQIIIDLFARHDPGNVKAAILIGPTITKSERWLPLQLLRWMQNGLYEPFGGLVLLMRDFFDTGVRRLWQTGRIAVADRPETKITALTVPTLVMRGGNDPLARRDWTQQLTAQLPDAEYREIPGRGHIVMLNAPEEAARLIDEFTAALRDRYDPTGSTGKQ